MATGALVFTWHGARQDREGLGLDVFSKVLAYLDGLVQSGRITDHSEYFSLSGEALGMLIIRGDLQQLASLQAEEEHIGMQLQAAHVSHDFKTQLFEGGSGSAVQESVKRYRGHLQHLGTLK